MVRWVVEFGVFVRSQPSVNNIVIHLNSIVETRFYDYLECKIPVVNNKKTSFSSTVLRSNFRSNFRQLKFPSVVWPGDILLFSFIKRV